MDEHYTCETVIAGSVFISMRLIYHNNVACKLQLQINLMQVVQ